MKLQEAIKLSEVDYALDPEKKGKPRAIRPYYGVKPSTGEAVTQLSKRVLVAVTMNEIYICWADTLKPISENMKFYERDINALKLLDLDDWYPV